MKLVRLALRRETAVPVLALIFATAACVLMVSVRIFQTRQFGYSFLVWNLFLAWLPVVFAMLACDHYRNAASRPNRQFTAFAIAWLLFFPNAPYIVTDLVHVTARFSQHFWVDLVLILACALTGLVLGFLSLYLMHSLVRKVFGGLSGWVFIALVSALSGFGIYLGRFLRFNSWDILWKPLELTRGVNQWFEGVFHHPSTVSFPAIFAAFLFITYVMLYALTHLRDLEGAHYRPAIASIKPERLPGDVPKIAVM